MGQIKEQCVGLQRVGHGALPVLNENTYEHLLKWFIPFVIFYACVDLMTLCDLCFAKPLFLFKDYILFKSLKGFLHCWIWIIVFNKQNKESVT